MTQKIIEYIFLEDLIDCSNFSKLTYKTKGILYIKKQDTKPNIQKKFINSNEYKWLLQKLKGSKTKKLKFGELSYLLHNSIITNQRIYRKNVKNYLVVLIDWINYFDDLEIIIINHKHTQEFLYHPLKITI